MVTGQILDRLAYLAFKKLEHGSLKYSNTLMTREGVIKIGTPGIRNPPPSLTESRASQELFHDVGSTPVADLADIKALGYIAIELMQIYPKDDGATRVEDSDRWPSDSKAVHFLMTTSTTSMNALRKMRSLFTRRVLDDISSIHLLHPTSARKS